MSFDYIKMTYGLEFRRGMRVVCGDKKIKGKVTRATHYVWVKPEGQKHADPWHPRDVKSDEEVKRVTCLFCGSPGTEEDCVWSVIGHSPIMPGPAHGYVHRDLSICHRVLEFMKGLRYQVPPDVEAFFAGVQNEAVDHYSQRSERDRFESAGGSQSGGEHSQPP